MCFCGVRVCCVHFIKSWTDSGSTASGISGPRRFSIYPSQSSFAVACFLVAGRAEQKVLGALQGVVDWSEVMDMGSGQVYFWNSSTNEVAWDPPEDSVPRLFFTLINASLNRGLSKRKNLLRSAERSALFSERQR